MRTETEIRATMRKLGDGRKLPVVEEDGVRMVPLNEMAWDILRWVVGEESTFGEVLAAADAQVAAARRADAN